MVIASGGAGVVPREAANIAVVIPTLNEEQSIGDVVRRMPRDLVRRVIVADGGSSDATAARAAEAGADVIDGRARIRAGLSDGDHGRGRCRHFGIHGRRRRR